MVPRSTSPWIGHRARMYFSSSEVQAGRGGTEARWSAGGVRRLGGASRLAVKTMRPSRTTRVAATVVILAAGDHRREGARSGGGPPDVTSGPWSGVASLRPIGYFASLRLRSPQQ